MQDARATRHSNGHVWWASFAWQYAPAACTIDTSSGNSKCEQNICGHADITKASSAIGKVFTTIDRIPKIRDAPDGESGHPVDLMRLTGVSSTGFGSGHHCCQQRSHKQDMLGWV